MQTSPFISELGNFRSLQGPVHLCSRMEESVRDVSVGLVADGLYLGLVVLCGCLVLKCLDYKLCNKMVIATLAQIKHGLVCTALIQWVNFSLGSVRMQLGSSLEVF